MAVVLSNKALRLECLKLALAKGYSLNDKEALGQVVDDYYEIVMQPFEPMGEEQGEKDPETPGTLDGAGTAGKPGPEDSRKGGRKGRA